jgi:hypothetical protein
LEIALHHKRGTVEGATGLGARLGAKLYEPYIPPPFVIEGVLAQAKVAELVAYGGSAKTWIAIAAGVDVALGLPWMGRFPTTQGRVLYLDWENGSDEMRRRVQMYLRGKGHEGAAEHFDVLTMPGVYMDDAAFEELLAGEVEGHALCIIDTLKAASPNVDENSSAIRVGLDKLKRVAERTGCAFIIIVHSKKTAPDGKEGDPREAARGSSAIFDAADVAMQIRYRPGEPALVRSTKSRNGKSFEPFTFELQDTEDDGILILTGSPVAEESRRADWTRERQDAIVEIVKENPGASTAAVMDGLKARGMGVKKTALPALLNSLATHGALKNHGTDKRQEWRFCSHVTGSQRWDTSAGEEWES